LLFGLLHGALIWYGDILLCYAIAGFLAAHVRSWSPGKLFGGGAVLFVAFAALEAGSTWAMAYFPEAVAESMPFATPEAARADIAAFGGTFAQSLTANFEAWMTVTGYTLFYVPATVGLMMIGMGLFKTGVLTARRGVFTYVLLLLVGGAAFAALGWAVCRELAGDMDDAFAGALRTTINSVLAPVMTLGYVALICLIVKSPLRGLTRPLSAAGQMAFTNYLTQSIIMTSIFYGGRGPGLFGTMTLAEQAMIVGGVWLAQLIWSPLWLMAFRYGPFEWIWRSLTLGRPVPFRRVAGQA
jgi:uncharacterized protein